MNRLRARHLVSILFAAMLLASNAVSVQAALPATLDTELTTLPPPTEAQLRRGDQILDQIAYVVENVALQDATAVMRVFGFTNLYTTVRKTYVAVQPSGLRFKTAQPADLAGTGFRYIDVVPVIRSGNERISARLNGRFNPDEACISFDAVRLRFGGTGRTIRKMPRMRFDYRPTHSRVTDADDISFDPLETPKGMVGSIGFTFEYQFCASQFGFVYLANQETK